MQSSVIHWLWGDCLFVDFILSSTDFIGQMICLQVWLNLLALVFLFNKFLDSTIKSVIRF